MKKINKQLKEKQPKKPTLRETVIQLGKNNMLLYELLCDIGIVNREVNMYNMVHYRTNTENVKKLKEFLKNE